MSAKTDALPFVRQVHVNGVDLSYVEQGEGDPVVFVHGAFSDHRYWEPQRHAIAEHYRFIAYDWRYHGPGNWLDEGQQYIIPVHALDLAGLIKQLHAAPAHLVALSAGAIPATLIAVEYPELVRTLTLVEPALTALTADLPEAKSAAETRSAATKPVIAAAKAGDAALAARLLFELVNNQGPGSFDRQPTPASNWNSRKLKCSEVISSPKAPAARQRGSRPWSDQSA